MKKLTFSRAIHLRQNFALFTEVGIELRNEEWYLANDDTEFTKHKDSDELVTITKKLSEIYKEAKLLQEKIDKILIKTNEKDKHIPRIT